MLLDMTLLLYEQVAAVARRVYFQLQPLCQRQPFLDKKDLAMIAHAMVRSWLDCCNHVRHLGLALEGDPAIATVAKCLLLKECCEIWQSGIKFQ